MSDSSGTGDTNRGSDAESRGPSDVPEESPSSESDLALSEQVAQRERDGRQDDE